MIKSITNIRFLFLTTVFTIIVLNAQKHRLLQFFGGDDVTAADIRRSPVDQSKSPFQSHELLSSESVADRVINTNSSDYKWLGNQWVPPPGVPVFTPSQIKSYFTKRNVLIIGDSTSRRFYMTMRGLMGAHDLHNIKKNEVDGNEKLSMNKDGSETSCEELNRELITMSGKRMSACMDLPSDGDHKVAVAGDNSTQKTVKFDQTVQYCYRELAFLWRDDDADKAEEVRGIHFSSSNMTMNSNLKIFSENYDLVIIANGIWEIANEHACLKHTMPNSTTPGRLKVALDRIHRNTPKDLQVMFRTSAFDTRHEGKDEKLRESIEVAKQYFYDKKNGASFSGNDGDGSNIGLVDWGGVMEHRSYGKDRIQGDHPAHYGLEGRTLYIQQLMHELVKSDLMKSARNEK